MKKEIISKLHKCLVYDSCLPQDIWLRRPFNAFDKTFITNQCGMIIATQCTDEDYIDKTDVIVKLFKGKYKEKVEDNVRENTRLYISSFKITKKEYDKVILFERTPFLAVRILELYRFSRLLKGNTYLISKKGPFKSFLFKNGEVYMFILPINRHFCEKNSVIGKIKNGCYENH